MSETQNITDLRLDRLEEAMSSMRLETMDGIKRLDDKLDAIVRIETIQGNQTSAIERIFGKLEQHNHVLYGKEGTSGVVGEVQASKVVIESHRWALRTVAALIAAEILAAIGATIAWLIRNP